MNNFERRLTRPDIAERDVDEAIVAALDRSVFSHWFVKTVDERAAVRLKFDRIESRPHVRRSDVSGETDIQVDLWSRTRRTAILLIENKIDSRFTATQPQRYAQACERIVASGMAPKAISVLLCPADYERRSTWARSFDAIVTYEELLRHLPKNSRATVSDAILRYETPYFPESVPAVAEFFSQYHAFCREKVPLLIVKRNPNVGGERPAGSRTISFDTAKTLRRYAFLPTVRFAHQCIDGSYRPSVKIMISGWAEHLGLLQQYANSDLSGTSFYLREAGNSLGIVADTPRLDNHVSFHEQLDDVLAGLRKAEALRDWFNSNEAALKRWANAAWEHGTAFTKQPQERSATAELARLRYWQPNGQSS
ncbi:MAG: hypothetical protein AB7S71_14620 [Dongiaceae bacterium]